eukprot:2013329-Lingulodinium_polyedra.AAC.1
MCIRDSTPYDAGQPRLKMPPCQRQTAGNQNKSCPALGLSKSSATKRARPIDAPISRKTTDWRARDER